MALISGFFDLESKKIQDQISVAKELNLKYISLRYFDDKEIHELDDNEIKTYFDTLKSHKLQVASIDMLFDDYHVLEEKDNDLFSRVFSNVEKLHAKTLNIMLPKIDDFDSQYGMLVTWMKSIQQETKKMKFALSFKYRVGYLSGHIAYLVKNLKQMNFVYDGPTFYENHLSTTTTYRLLKNQLSSMLVYDLDKDFEPYLLGYGSSNIVDVLKRAKRDSFKAFVVIDSNLSDYLTNRLNSYEKKGFFSFLSKQKSTHGKYLKMDAKIGVTKEDELTYTQLLKSQIIILNKIFK